jgi:hypothetical protein
MPFIAVVRSHSVAAFVGGPWAERRRRSLLSRLADWVVNVAPREPLPMSPSEAVALAERVHKAIAGK